MPHRWPHILRFTLVLGMGPMHVLLGIPSMWGSTLRPGVGSLADRGPATRGALLWIFGDIAVAVFLIWIVSVTERVSRGGSGRTPWLRSDLAALVSTTKSNQPGSDVSKKNNRQNMERRAKLEQLRAEHRRSERRRTLLVAAVAASVGVVIIAVTAIGVYNARNDKKQEEAAAASPIDGAQTYDSLTRNHVTGSVDYPQTPPVGGDHNGIWQNCGLYTSPIGDTNAVHTLEHGAVWIAYQPDLSTDQVKTLGEVSQGKDYALVAPYEGLDSPVVATAWGVQLQLESADDPRLQTFLTKYLQGQQTPEPGASCVGGVGAPA